MKLFSLRPLAALGAIALCLTLTSGKANAQTVVQASITTNAAITVVDGVDMAFGEWFLVHGGAPANDFNIVLDTAGGVTDTAVAPSLATEITPGPVSGTVTVELPAAATVQMTRGVIADFADPGLTLTAITYATATEAEAPLLLVAVPVTVTAPATPETVSFGATVAVTATPGDAIHTASFAVSFAY
jgi:hypothetical protein